MSSQGYYLQALHQALIAVLPPKCQRLLDSWMEQGQLRLEPKNMGPTGVNVALLTYRAVYTLEGLPFRECDPAVLLATVCAWLQDHDDQRAAFELPDPEFAITENDEHSADLEVQVEFVEPLRLSPDPQGPVIWNGQRWAVMPYEIWVADRALLQVGATPAHTVGDEA